ncbi:hypothetical protein NST99_15345 [Paenibacillus sp. FSL L8-0470]|uniref:hypothetical protein n=1 Tax=Paenibacillus sp. FSL L8-0470 TaxID=2954688 RepID=UPI0030FAB5B4
MADDSLFPDLDLADLGEVELMESVVSANKWTYMIDYRNRRAVLDDAGYPKKTLTCKRIASGFVSYYTLLTSVLFSPLKNAPLRFHQIKQGVYSNVYSKGCTSNWSAGFFAYFILF